VGAYQSAVTFPSSEVAQRNKTVWFVNIAVKDEITERGYNYVFRDYSKTSYDTKELIRAIKNFSKETGHAPKTFGLLYEGTDWGRGVASFSKKDFPAAGFKMVYDEAVTTGHTDFKPQILKMKKSKPDMLVVALYTSTHILLNKQMLEEKAYLPYGLWSLGGGSEDPTLYESLPVEAVEYMFVHDDTDVLASEKPWIKEISKKIKDKIGVGLTTASYGGYGPTYVVKDVLERAASRDRDAIRDAFAATDITAEHCGNIERKCSSGEEYCPALIRGILRVKFDEEGQNTFSAGQITQNQKGKKVPLFPLGLRQEGKKPFWPVPKYEDR
jgi:branched-chain amino acid transport system substrate-binding protein